MHMYNYIYIYNLGIHTCIYTQCIHTYIYTAYMYIYICISIHAYTAWGITTPPAATNQPPMTIHTLQPCIHTHTVYIHTHTTLYNLPYALCTTPQNITTPWHQQSINQGLYRTCTCPASMPFEHASSGRHE